MTPLYTLPLFLLMAMPAWGEDLEQAKICVMMPVGDPPTIVPQRAGTAVGNITTPDTVAGGVCHYEDHDICPPKGLPKIVITIDPGGSVGLDYNGAYLVTRTGAPHTIVLELQPDGSIQKTQDYEDEP
jgi:hypothetical protein